MIIVKCHGEFLEARFKKKDLAKKGEVTSTYSKYENDEILNKLKYNQGIIKTHGLGSIYLPKV